LAAHQPIMQLAEAAGFFPASFGEPDMMLDRRPAGNLGPRYRVEYRVPGPDDDELRIVQDLYPYAGPDLAARAHLVAGLHGRIEHQQRPGPRAEGQGTRVSR